MQKIGLCIGAPLAYGLKVNPSDPKPHAPERKHLIDEIRHAGLRATSSRVAVLRMLHEAHRPMSHAEVSDALSEHTWNRSTLYRNLMDLAEAGLLRRSELGDHTWRFEVSCDHGHDDHSAHFLCNNCGDIVCLPELTVTPRGSAVLPQVFSRGEYEVQISGRCATCLDAA